MVEIKYLHTKMSIIFKFLLQLLIVQKHGLFWFFNSMITPNELLSIAQESFACVICIFRSFSLLRGSCYVTQMDT